VPGAGNVKAGGLLEHVPAAIFVPPAPTMTRSHRHTPRLLATLTAALLAAPASLAGAGPVDEAVNGETATNGAVARAADAEPGYRFAVAKMLAAEGDLAAAVDALRAVVDEVPDDPWVRVEYAALLAETAESADGAPDGVRAAREAVAHAEAAGRLLPDEPEAWRALARARLAVARRDAAGVPAALEALERVRDLAPEDLQNAVTLGQLYLNLDRPDDAAEVFAQVAERTSGNPYVEGLLAQALLSAGREPEAEEALRRLVALEADNLRARLTLAGLESGRGDHAAALATLRAAPPAGGQAAEVERRIALELHLSGANDEALAAVERMLAAPGARPEPPLLALQALIFADEDRHAELAEVLDRLAPDDPSQRRLADLLEQRGAEREAERVLRRALERLDEGDPGTAWTLRRELAALLDRQGELDAAVEILAPGLAAAEAATRRQATLFSADLLSRGGDSRAALELLDRSELEPALAAPVRLQVLLRAGEETDARRLLRRLAGGRDEAAALAAIQAAQREERWELTIPLLERRFGAEDGTPAAGGRLDGLFLLAVAYERTGRDRDAIATFRRLVAARPDDGRALNYLGYMWAERNENLDEALELVRRAVSGQPDNGAYVDSLGWVHYRLGEYELALKYLQRAAALAPEDPEVFEHLGDVHRALGDRLRAKEFYMRALALAEDRDSELRHKLDDLQLD